MIRTRAIGLLMLLMAVVLPAGAQDTAGADSIADQRDFNIPVVEYSFPREYVVDKVTVSGVKFLDRAILAQITGLKTGDKVIIPGEKITRSVEKLWKQGLFSDIKVSYMKIEGNRIHIDYNLTERLRLSRFTFEGINRNDTQDLLETINMMNGSQVTENVINDIKKIISDYYIDKSFLNIKVNIIQKQSERMPNSVHLHAVVDKGEKVRISDITFEGNTAYEDSKLRRVMKNTKKRNINFFKASKYIVADYKEDRKSLSTFYNENGYRDFKIQQDSLIILNEERVAIVMKVFEGEKYYIRDIKWVGNTKFPSEYLSHQLNIKGGDPYNSTLLDERLSMDEDAVNSLYMDQGYLWAGIMPVEVLVEEDSIDIEMRVREGEPAYINRIIINGNTKTNERVVRRELRTDPGNLFSKKLLIRDAREIAQLGHFDPEKINPVPLDDMANSTVDIEYNLEEKANDQFEISGGWGAGMLVGTVGLRFNNFSLRRVLEPKAWRPVPSGDGQSLSLRAQSNGRYYQSYSFTFVEPWLGGKKPNSFSFSAYRSAQSNGRKKTDPYRESMFINGVTMGLGKRLKWPDDYFTLYSALSFQSYQLENWNRYFLFSNGSSNILSLQTTVGRNSAGPNPIYPMGGSNLSMSLQLTPPWSLINGKDYTDPDLLDDKYSWVEYHKWDFKTEWYLNLVDKLVFYTRFHFGYLGFYNEDIGPSPFESYDVGGDGMSGYNLYGVNTVGLRGYENGSLTPRIGGSKAGNVYEKLTMELRYPITLSAQATVFGLIFVEGGNAWSSIQTFNPYGIKKSAGVGLRAFLPMFGLLGIDWAYGFNPVPGMPDANGGQFHFVIGQQF